MKSINLLQHIWIIDIHVAEPNKAIWVLLDKRLGLGKSLRRGQQKSQAIDLVHLLQHSIENARFAVVVHVNINQLGHGILRERHGWHHK